MNKPTQATNFRKRQVLPAAALNRAIKEYGSAGGVVPYTDDGAQDRSMSAPLGTKEAPFGDAHFKGFNLYTEVEVQALVSSGKLGAADRFVFWDLNTNSLAAWNGTEIIQLGGGGSSMDYLFGDGSDGEVTVVSSANFDIPKNFTRLVINSGVTLSVSIALTPLVLRAKTEIIINGTLDLTGKGYPAESGLSEEQATEFGLVRTSDGRNSVSAYYARYMGLSNLSFSFGGGGGNGGGTRKNGFGVGCGNNNGNKGGGGGGGGSGLFICKDWDFTGVLSSNGGSGGASYSSGTNLGRGGAGGGSALLSAPKISGSGNIIFNGQGGSVGGSSGSLSYGSEGGICNTVNSLGSVPVTLGENYNTGSGGYAGMMLLLKI